MRGRGGPMGGPPRGGPVPRGAPRGFRGGPMRGGGGGDRGGRNFVPAPQGPGPHPVPTIETRGAPPQRKPFIFIQFIILTPHKVNNLSSCISKDREKEVCNCTRLLSLYFSFIIFSV